MTKLEYTLGDRVRMTGTVAKTHQDEGRRGCRTLYVEAPLPSSVFWSKAGQRIEAHAEGIITGWRTVIDGMTLLGSEAGEWFSYTTRTFGPDPSTARRVWLVTYNLRRNPVMCFPEQLERITND